jgi:crotonobetainyl-CoA:carnitine CoA-transferase CaiB-like acyl-CoA transferase
MTASLLGDFGADVIKIERPGHGDPLRWNHKHEGVGLFYKMQARNKRCVTLDLGSTEGKQLFHRLVRISDAVVENFRPGVMERLGNDWPTLQKLNNRLVYCRISGWGQTGPYATRPSLGRVAEAFSGFAELTGTHDGPPMHSTMALGDSTCAIWAAYSIMLSLYWRDAKGGGEGQLIDLGLYEPLYRQIEQQIVVADKEGTPLRRLGNLTAGSPVMGCYETADGRWFSFSANTERSIRAVMRALELDGDDRFDGYDACLKNHRELEAHARRWIRQRSAEAIVLAFDAAGAPGTPVMSASDLIEDPQVQHREMVVTVPDDDLGQVRMQGIVPKLSRTPGAITHAGQRMGQANEQVFGELLGLSSNQLADLQEKGVI